MVSLSISAYIEERRYTTSTTEFHQYAQVAYKDLLGSGSTVRHSTSTSPCTGSQGSPGRESQDLNSNDFPDDDDLGDDEEF